MRVYVCTCVILRLNSTVSCATLFFQQYDQKNIRRRVYDALNVLMAMNIISKEKKEIRWLGLPTNSLQECAALEKDKKKKIERIKTKTQQLHQLILSHISFKNLVERNRLNESLRGPPKPNSAIQLPFLIVNTSKKTVIDCSISNDKYVFRKNYESSKYYEKELTKLLIQISVFAELSTCLILMISLKFMTISRF